MITVSEKAIKELKNAIEDHKSQDETIEDMYVRFGVKGGGCSGFEWTLALVEEVTAKDEKFEIDGLKFVVDNKSVLYVKGTNLDFHDGLDKRGFKFENPSVTKTCGCGSSFSM